MTTVKTGDVKNIITAFEKALKKTEDATGRVNVAALKAEVKSEATTKPLAEAFERTIDTIEDRFTRSVRTNTGSGCGSSIVQQPPKTLSAREVKSVFTALLEAKTKGIDTLDKNGDGKLTPKESHAGPERTFAQRLTHDAAEAATGDAPKPAKPKPPPVQTGGSTSAGCGGAVAPKPPTRTGSSGGSGC